jgi:hypothetical protein
MKRFESIHLDGHPKEEKTYIGTIADDGSKIVPVRGGQGNKRVVPQTVCFPFS